MFIACHPVLSAEARVALTLRLLGGLTTDEIARAYLVPEPTIAQRIVRAKKTLAKKRVPFEVPAPAERMVRLASLLEVIYLVFNEGYSATAGEDWIRPSLCEEALRLGRVLATLVPAEAEAHGLVALMELQASRFRARVGPRGEAILLLDQDRGRWDRLLDRPRPGRARSRHRARRGRRLLRAAGRHRRLSRAGGDTGGDRLGAHRVALRPARRRHAVADRAPEPRRGGGPGRRSGRRAWRWSTRWQRIRRWRRIHTCRARAAICWNDWAGSRRRAPNSFAPPP